MSAEQTRQAIEKEGLVNRLSYPSAPGTHPTVTVLGGSGGGLKEGGAAALSSERFTALALCYFGLDPLPPKLVEIPLEYFSKAITWLRALLAAFGVAHDSDTRWIDGELALLLGAAYPEDIRASWTIYRVVWSGRDRSSTFSRSAVPGTHGRWKASRSSGLRRPALGDGKHYGALRQ